MRGEVQVAAINGTTDAVCYSVINSPGQQSGEATSAWIELKFKWRHNYSINKQRKLSEVIIIVVDLHPLLCQKIIANCIPQSLACSRKNQTRPAENNIILKQGTR